MEVTIKKKEVCDLIERYYRDIKGIDTKVKISTRREPVGLFEVMCCVTRIEVTKNITLLGLKQTVKDELSRDEVIGIFRELLSGSGYEATSLCYDDGINNEIVGYYMGEHTEYKPYFNGIKLYVKKTKETNKKLNR